VSSHYPGTFITAVVTGGTCVALRSATPHIPNSEFVLSWKRLTGFRAGIDCVGKPLEPELVVPALTEEEMRSLPADGAILPGRTYDDVNEELTRRRGAA